MMARYLHNQTKRTGRIIYTTPVSAVLRTNNQNHRIPIKDIIEPASQYYQRWFLNVTLTGVALWFAGIWAMVFVVAVIMLCKSKG